MGHSTPEWVFIGVVTAILIWVGADSWQVEHSLEYAPPNAETVRVIGQQWFWSFQHADGTQEINELHIKQGVPYRFEIVSNDVIHSFSIPDFAVLMDAVPGRVNTLWNIFDEPGEYLIECREYCGMLHMDMRARLFVEPNTDNGTSSTSSPESEPTISQGTGTATVIAPGGSEVGSSGTGTMTVVEPGNLTQTPSGGTANGSGGTSSNGTSGDNATSGATAGGPSLSIPAGASTPGNPSYSPATLTVSKGDVITVSNDDTAPHTVTNGASPGDADAGKLFDTSIIMPAATATIDTASLEAGEHPFHCTVHPFMTGSLTVQ